MRLAHTCQKATSEDNAFYVFNRADEAGFIIVSADDRTAEDVLGYTEDGSFDADHINPNLRFWLSRYAEEISSIKDNDEAAAQPRKAVQVTAIPNLLKNAAGTEITWYQEAPYYNYCPIDQRDQTRCLTGCVATATSAIMYKWQYPAKGTGTHSYTWKDCLNNSCSSYKDITVTSNFDTVSFDWANLLPAYEGKSYTTAQAKAVASLMYNVGVAADMQYGGDATGGSGAWTDVMANGLKTYFGYTFDKFITMYSKSDYGTAAVTPAEYNVTSSQFTTYFNADLEAGRPILMGGEDTEGGGHEFVCCGRDANNKFYINWGWEGDGNGYYALSSLKPNSNYNFSTNLDALIGLRPAKTYDDQNVTWMANGSVFANNVATAGVVTLPATNPADCEGGKVFVGWTATKDYEAAAIAPTYVKGGELIEAAATYYAVYATQQSGGCTTEVTYNPSTMFENQNAAGTKEIDGVTFVFAKAGNSSNEPKYYSTGSSVRMYANNTLTISAATAISAIAFTYGSTTTAGLTASAGTLDGANWTGNATSVTFTAGASGQQHIQKIVVTVGGGASYKDYATVCGGEVTPVNPDTFTIAFYNNGTMIGEAQEVEEGQSPEVPAAPEAACTGYTFYGWYTEALAQDNTQKPTAVTDFKAVKDQNYYAVFTKTEGGEGGAAFDGTTGGTFKIYALVGDVKYYAKAYAKKIESTTDINEAADYTFEKVEGGFAIKYGDKYIKYGTSGTDFSQADDAYTWTIGTPVKGSWRLVASSAETRSFVYRSGEINKFAPYASSNIKADGNEYFDIEIGGGASSTTYYCTVVSCDPTGVIDVQSDKAQSTKVIINGQLFIMHDGRMYNVQGVRVK